MINVGIIGSGYIAHTHANSVNQIKSAKLTGVVGGKRARDFSKKYDIITTKCY